MNRLRPSYVFILALLVTLASLGVWAATERHYYTKYEVVERVEVDPDEDDLFAGTGLQEEGEPEYETRKRESFHLGLLPTPEGLFDKHIVSVLSISAPFWALAVLWGLLVWWRGGEAPPPVPEAAQGEAEASR